MALVAILGLTLAVGLALYFLGKQPQVHKIRQGELGRFLEVLFRRGYDRGYMRIRVPGQKLEGLQVTKYIVRRGKVGLQLDFPGAACSERFYPRVRELLTAHEVPFEIEGTETPSVPEFLVVDFGPDVQMATEAVQTLLQEVFELGPDKAVELYYVNINPRDEPVGF